MIIKASSFSKIECWRGCCRDALSWSKCRSRSRCWSEPLSRYWSRCWSLVICVPFCSVIYTHLEKDLVRSKSWSVSRGRSTFWSRNI